MKKVSSWKELTLREKIGQTVVCQCETEKHIEMCGSIEKFLEKYPVGGIFNNKGLVKGLMVGANPNFKDDVKEYNKYLRVPLITSADGGGFAEKNNIGLPKQMALGATDDKKLAYNAGEFMAEDYKKVGIHWGFWPECDLNMSKFSPVTDTRSVSDNWELTLKIVKEEIKAMKDRGVIATLKHYPGTAFDEYIDAHLAPFDNKTPIELWRNTYGKMYKALFEEGAPAIMTGHQNLALYQTEKNDGQYPGATLSYELTTKLLREELGFKGVTVTDALVMGGFGGNQAAENAVKSFLSGNDVLLWPCYEYIDLMEEKILSGEISEKRLDEAVERIWNLKKEYGILEGKSFDSDVDIDFFKEISENISKKGLTLISDNNNIIPADKNKIKNVMIIVVTPDDRQYEDLCKLKEMFEEYGCNVNIKRNIWTDETEKACKENDLIIFALCRTPHRPIGPMDFWGDEATSIWASNCADKSKTVVASFGTPYFYKYYKNSGVTYINAYSYDENTMKTFVKGVFGDLKFGKKSPINISIL